MNAKKCDRCGKYFEKDNEYLEFELINHEENWETLPAKVDLCKECKKDFISFCKKK